MRGADELTYIALGYLSTLTSFGKGRSTATQSRIRRELIRNHSSTQTGVATRFVLAHPPTELVHELVRHHRRRIADGASHSAVCASWQHGWQEEQSRHGDLVLLNMTEGFFDCPRKYLLWFRLARSHFPTARFIAVGDDDTYVSLPHLLADLQIVEATMANPATTHVLWGLITWKAFYNNVSQDTSTGFESWSNSDGPAVAKRRRIDSCVSALTRSTHTRSSARQWLEATAQSRQRRSLQARKNAMSVPNIGTTGTVLVKQCRGLPTKTLDAVLSGAIDPTPPWPMANGPLFAISQTLADVVTSDPLPEAWLARVHETDMARWMAKRHNRVPHVLQRCGHRETFQAQAHRTSIHRGPAHENQCLSCHFCMFC